MKDGMTHKYLVRRMSRWLKVTKRMTVVMTELSTANRETPDVIGWHGNAGSILVECKASRADFLADKKKIFRHYEDYGMGEKRYFAVPKGLVDRDELPDGWGLIVIDNYVRIVVEATPKKANMRAECKMLMSALRRLEISTAVYVVAEPRETE